MPFPSSGILVPLEDSGTEKALVRLSATLASARHSALHLVHIALGEGAAQGQRPPHLQSAVEVAAAQGISPFTHQLRAPTLTQAIQQALDLWECNMVVMDWSPEFERGPLLSAYSRPLTQSINADTLILKERDFRPARRILVPTGGGGHALVGMHVASDLARSWGAEMEVLRIARDPERRPGDPLLQRYCTQIREDTRLQLKLLDIDAALTVVSSTEIVSPIVQRARQRDLMVVGVSNAWRPEEHPSGSIPDELAERVPCSVLMVRTPAPARIKLSDLFWEHTIRLELHPADKWEAITRMVDILVEERQIHPAQRRRVLDAALARERKGTTALGHRTAIPHAPISELPGIIGALGICPEGLDFEAVDGEPVQFIFLLLTPHRYRRYIPVLAQIAALMRSGETRAAFLACQTPAELTALIKKREQS